MNDIYEVPPELVLGTKLNDRVPCADQTRQLAEVKEILRRLRTQPGVILADEVGTGKTFVALAIAYSVAMRSQRGPVIVMVPPNLVDKWAQDLTTFCELYLESRHAMPREKTPRRVLTNPEAVRYGVARHSSELMKLLDDTPRERCHLILLGQGALSRRQTDKWIRLALIAEALRRHARGKASRLIQVKRQIHRFLAELLWAIGEERAQDLGEKLWQELLHSSPSGWRQIYNDAVRDERRQLADDPVPKVVVRSLDDDDIDLRPLAESLTGMPVRARGGRERVSERLNAVRKELRQVEDALWGKLLAQARWRSPLLVMDEAHHLKNPATALARQLQSPESEQDLRTGDGAMARAFDRMLFLTATPFQLGHRELIHILARFGDVRWAPSELGEPDEFQRRLADLSQGLDDSQRSAIALQRAWSKFLPEDCPGDGDHDAWWKALCAAKPESLTSRQRAVLDAYAAAARSRSIAEAALRPWVVRHNKEPLWPDTQIRRRDHREGAAIAVDGTSAGLAVPSEQLLPFFLAARSAVNPGKDLLGEALSSSFEAFRFTRQDRDGGRDEQDEPAEPPQDLSHARWYLDEFDRALAHSTATPHPKVSATVKRIVDLWEAGEKVLVFAFYRRTCRALRIHVSQEIERRIMSLAARRLNAVGGAGGTEEIERLLARVQDRFFDDKDSPGRRALDQALAGILQAHDDALDRAGIATEQRDQLLDVMRRFLRVTTTLIRCFPLEEADSISPEMAASTTLDGADSSKLSWRQKFDGFLEFLTQQCSAAELPLFIGAALRTQTRGIRVSLGDGEDPGADTGSGTVTLANVQEATGDTDRDTRQRLMRAFNTPFFPDILVCSEVMGEGVDLQRFCRHVIHHDLAWNPSTIEQRTGRIDRLGCKAQGRHPIVVFLPFLAGAADERQFKVMSDREQWFRVLMGQDEVARLITPDATSLIPLPQAISDELSFKLGLGSSTP